VLTVIIRGLVFVMKAIRDRLDPCHVAADRPIEGLHCVSPYAQWRSPGGRHLLATHRLVGLARAERSAGLALECSLLCVEPRQQIRRYTGLVRK
jgi:hypothetical protein